MLPLRVIIDTDQWLQKNKKRESSFERMNIFKLQFFWVCNISSCKNEYVFGYFWNQIVPYLHNHHLQLSKSVGVYVP